MTKHMTKRHPLWSFFILTFVITWGLGASTLIFGEQLYNLFGEFGPGNPIYYISVAGPAISALVIISILYGRQGLVAYLRRFLHWKIGVWWAVIVFVGIPVLLFGTRVIGHLILDTPLAYPLSPWYQIIPLALWNMIYIPGAIEEFGWRGFALPLLQAKYSALKASLILGVIWALWHLPGLIMMSFYLEGGNTILASFIFYTCAVSVLMTMIYNGTRGSILIAFLTHWLINDPFQLRNYPADQLIVTVVLVITAVIAILITGHKNLGQTKWVELLPEFGLEQSHTQVPKAVTDVVQR